MNWLPIESAPKDGTGILLSNGTAVAHGHWLRDEGGTIEHRDLDGRYLGQDDMDGYEGWLDWDGGMIPPPTHWMPLPPPPTDDEPDGLGYDTTPTPDAPEPLNDQEI